MKYWELNMIYLNGGDLVLEEDEREVVIYYIQK